MSGSHCDVCGGLTVGVAASPLGGFSNAYCEECLRLGVEPYGDIVALSFCVDGLDNVVPELQDHINLSLERAGKTREEADAAGAKMQEQYVKDMQEATQRREQPSEQVEDEWEDLPF